jgi:hypothetical protein
MRAHDKWKNQDNRRKMREIMSPCSFNNGFSYEFPSNDPQVMQTYWNEAMEHFLLIV